MAKVQEFFFKAMVKGYASGGQKITIPDMPGYKAIPFREGDFYLLDRWSETANSTKSAGTTTIWYKNAPVWVMNFGGFYSEDAIAILKRALCKNYESGLFIGGRGPHIYNYGRLTYVNLVRRNDFTRFEGRENIFNADNGVLLGYHEYWGMSLV